MLDRTEISFLSDFMHHLKHLIARMTLTLMNLGAIGEKSKKVKMKLSMETVEVAKLR